MKKVYQTEKYIRYSMKVARKSLQKRLERKRILKAQRRANQGKSKSSAKRNLDRIRFKARVTAPENFSFLKNPEKSIAFINQLEEALNAKKSTFVILKKVASIDYNAITLLLSVMYKFKENKIKFNGDFPENEAARKLLTDSDFFLHLNKESNRIPKYVIRKENQILTTTDRSVDPEICLPIIEEATRTVWGKEEIKNGKGLFRVLIELMHNTHNHAAKNEGKKHWWLSINHDPDKKKVGFIFMDHGVGVFSSLSNKPTNNKWYGWQEKLKQALGTQTNEQVLKLLLDGRVHEIAMGKSTSTGSNFRGKGLPGVKGVLDRHQISHLYIITNNVYANVSEEKYTLLNNSFSGTFFYWELSTNNDRSLWKM